MYLQKMRAHFGQGRFDKSDEDGLDISKLSATARLEFIHDFAETWEAAADVVVEFEQLFSQTLDNDNLETALINLDIKMVHAHSHWKEVLRVLRENNMWADFDNDAVDPTDDSPQG
jgi:hypothetical protein